MSAQPKYTLGTVAASEALLDDLYLQLRRSVSRWAAITNQTPQARMGYVGQHLTSVVTGYPGGRSGARGKDLVLPGDRSAEIKTCYRIDQLGVCKECRHAVASIEVECPSCGSTAIDRKDDSKWLIGPSTEAELQALWAAESFYLVLFDFADFADPRDIHARIWEIDPRSPGFAFCLVDYYFNIRSRSTSKAPFNLWPFSLKFALLGGNLIYQALIREDDSIETLLFPNERGTPEPIPLGPLREWARTRTLSRDALERTARQLNIRPLSYERPELLEAFESVRADGSINEDEMKEALARGIYWPHISGFARFLPEALRP